MAELEELLRQREALDRKIQHEKGQIHTRYSRALDDLSTELEAWAETNGRRLRLGSRKNVAIMDLGEDGHVVRVAFYELDDDDYPPMQAVKVINVRDNASATFDKPPHRQVLLALVEAWLEVTHR